MGGCPATWAGSRHREAGPNLAAGYDVPAVWRDWAVEVDGHAIDAGHFLPEEAPNETYAALRAFFGA